MTGVTDSVAAGICWGWPRDCSDRRLQRRLRRGEGRGRGGEVWRNTTAVTARRRSRCDQLWRLCVERGASAQQSVGAADSADQSIHTHSGRQTPTRGAEATSAPVCGGCVRPVCAVFYAALTGSLGREQMRLCWGCQNKLQNSAQRSQFRCQSLHQTGD